MILLNKHINGSAYQDVESMQELLTLVDKSNGYLFGSTDFARSVAKDPFGYGVAQATEKYTSAYGKDSSDILREQQEAARAAEMGIDLADLGVEQGELMGDVEDMMKSMARANRQSEKR